MKPGQRYCTVAQAAEYIGSSEKFIRSLIARGDLTGYRVGARQIRLEVRELDAAMTPMPAAPGKGARRP